MSEYSISSLSLSLKRQETIFKSSLILNPTENVPLDSVLYPASSFLHGLYLNDKYNSKIAPKDSKIIFAGRNRSQYDMKVIYEYWADLLNAKKASMRLLSGLNAHAIVFMGIAKVGDKVLLLPEKAGGHFSTKAILERLGIIVIDMAVDNFNMKVNIDETIKIINKEKPNFLFFDRTEGLIYEDISKLIDNFNGYSVFDASQYLTNIILGKYKNPFDMGFDLILATLHKNFPGPQKAIVLSKEEGDMWDSLLYSLETYISNFHGYGNYIAGLTVYKKELLEQYSTLMIENTLLLEKFLKEKFNVVQRDVNSSPTHHIWLQFKDKESAYSMFKKLEKLRILTNYRLLAYDLGYGLRIGTSAATMCGLKPDHIEELAFFITKASENITLNLKHQVRSFIESVKTHSLI